MKKVVFFLCIMLSVISMFFCFNTNKNEAFADTINDAIVINSLDEITDLAGNYKLANDIDLEGRIFAPIGAQNNQSFTGTLDGNG